MKKLNLRLYLLLLGTLFFTSSIDAQENFLTSGNDIQGSNGSISESVGQVFYQIHSATANYTSEGVQQPFEIQLLTSIRESDGIELNAVAYPNPVREQLNLKVDQTSNSNLTYRIFDMNGSLLKESRIEDQLSIIYMDAFSKSVYLLKIYEEDQEVKVFKIIKH